MKTCEKCKKKYTLSQKDKAARRVVEITAGMFPGIKQATDQAKNYCSPCWTSHIGDVTEKVLAMRKEQAEKPRPLTWLSKKNIRKVE